MKKVLFTWIFKIDPLNGGVERVTSIVMEGLKARGYHCDNLIVHNNEDFYINNEVSAENHLSIDQLRGYLINQDYDVIVNQDGYNESTTRILKSIAPSHTKFVTSLHNAPTMYDVKFAYSNIVQEFRKAQRANMKFYWGLRLLIQPIWKYMALKGINKIYRQNYKYSDVYNLLSKTFFPDMCRKLGVKDASKLHAIPNPLTFDKIEPSSIIDSKKNVVLFVGRLDETQKKISFALKAWQLVQQKGFDNWSFRIVGHGPDEGFLKQMVVEEQIPNVTFEGRQTPIPYYEKASIFLMTSDFEGWGMTLTESLQYGVVPIARDTYSALHDIITDNYNGLIISSKGIRKYADSMIDLMTNCDKRRELALNGLKSAERFTHKKVVDQWEMLLEKLIENEIS